MESSRFSPEDREVSEVADEIIAEFDRIAFAGMNKILEEVRRQERLRLGELPSSQGEATD